MATLFSVTAKAKLFGLVKRQVFQRKAAMQTDGNLVVYDKTKARFSTKTAGNKGAKLWVQNNGVLAIFRPDGKVIWDSR